MSLFSRFVYLPSGNRKKASHRRARWSLVTGLRLSLLALFLGVPLPAAQAQGGKYEFQIIARDLARPTGIAASALGDSDQFYFTELPEPGTGGGANAVSQLTLSTGEITVLQPGEPEPTNIVQDTQGNLYWTCRSAGVIVTQAPNGEFTILVRDLQQPVGISVDLAGENLYFTEVPTPGVGGPNGGQNQVSQLSLATLKRTVVHFGDPEPTQIVVASNGDLFWTCKSAGVIAHYSSDTGKTSIALGDLEKPVGLALDATEGNLYFTEVPTPGQSGSEGGTNRVSRFDLQAQRSTLVHFGDPEPTSVTVAANGNVYWTCTSAGVIVEARLIE